MIASHSIPITYKGVQATLEVLRNDGFCWGRITTEQGAQLDVNAPEGEDLYDWADSDAIDRLEELAQDESNVTPGVGWLS